MPILFADYYREAGVLQTVAQRVDFALRVGAVDLARDLTDEALLARVLGPSWKSAVAELREAVHHRREARQKGAGRTRLI